MTTTDAATPAPPSPGGIVDPARRRSATIGGAFGFFVDMYDVYLPTITLTPALVYFTPDTVSKSTQGVVLAMVFVATLIGRPLGSIIFGRLADRIGRRRTTIYAVAGCGVTTLAIAALPGYSSWGITAVAILIALRLLDGVFLGGEYTGAMPLAIETAGNHRRGLYGSLVGMGFPLAYCAIAIATFIVEQFAGTGGPTAAFSEWGWRIPFVVGALLSICFLVYYIRNVQESPMFSAREGKRRNPLLEVAFGPWKRNFWQVFVLMAGVWFASNMASGVLPASLASQTTLSATQITGVIVVAQFIHAGCFPLFGLFVDRYGRRTFFLICGFSVGIVCSALFAFLAGGNRSGLVELFFVTLLIRISGASMFAITPAYICERFPSVVRGSGFGLGYSMPLLVTAGYTYYQGWLKHIMGYSYTPVVLLVIGGVLITLGAFIGPETRDVDLGADVRETREPRAATAARAPRAVTS
jgi:MFS family permease